MGGQVVVVVVIAAYQQLAMVDGMRELPAEMHVSGT